MLSPPRKRSESHAAIKNYRDAAAPGQLLTGFNVEGEWVGFPPMQCADGRTETGRQDRAEATRRQQARYLGFICIKSHQVRRRVQFLPWTLDASPPTDSHARLRADKREATQGIRDA